MKISAGSKAISLIDLAYKSNQPILLIGKHGIGKSQLIQEAAKSMGIDCIVRDLSLMEPPDLAGMPKIEDGEMSYATPSFLPTKGKGLLVFEEVNRSQRYIQSPCLQLLTDRTLNDYVLPKGWLPVACINPANDEYQTTDLDPALLSRFMQIEIEPSVEGWGKWATENNVNSRVINYLLSSGDEIFESPMSNPRSWTYVSNTLDAANNQEVDEEIVLTAIQGLIGESLGYSFWRYIHGTEHPLQADEILNDYTSKRPMVLGWKENGKLDLLQASFHHLKTYMQASSNVRAVNEDRVKASNIKTFLNDLPGDLRLKAAGLIKRLDA